MTGQRRTRPRMLVVAVEGEGTSGLDGRIDRERSGPDSVTSMGTGGYPYRRLQLLQSLRLGSHRVKSSTETL